MALKRIVDNGKLKFAKAKFGRESRKSVNINFYAGCTFIHLNNFKNGKTFSLGIGKYEELGEILLDSLVKVDERFRNEDEEENVDLDVALRQTKTTESVESAESDDDTDISNGKEQEKKTFISMTVDEVMEGKKQKKKRNVKFKKESDKKNKIPIVVNKIKKKPNGKSMKDKETRV